MFTFCLLLILAFCDNIEISVADFDTIYYENSKLYSKDIAKYNSVKISHPGTSILRLKKIGPKIYQLVDTSVYLKHKINPMIRIDLEYKVYGLEVFVWKFLAYILTVLVIFNIFLKILFVNFDNAVKFADEECNKINK